MQGGRHTPFFSNYRPQFFIRTADVTGSIQLPDGVEMVMPGDNATLTVNLITEVPIAEVCVCVCVCINLCLWLCLCLCVCQCVHARVHV